MKQIHLTVTLLLLTFGGIIFTRYVLLGDGRRMSLLNCVRTLTAAEASKAAGPCEKQQIMRRANRGVAHYSPAFYERLRALTSRNATSRDPALIALVRDVIDPPSDHVTLKMANFGAISPQAAEIQRIYNNSRNGFFVECGATDGQHLSNTVHLELTGWRGLLVEMDPFFYTQLLGRSRRAWSLHACLSPFDYVSELAYHRDQVYGQGRIGIDKPIESPLWIKVPCFPFETMLLALNRTHVDYFSLDVEGVELTILRSIPFDRVTVNTLSVEHLHIPEGKGALAAYMEKQGYRVHKDIHVETAPVHADDYIFVHQSPKFSDAPKRL